MESIRDILSNYNAVPGMADALIKAGLHPIPIPAGTKGPKGKGWQEKDFGPESFRPGSNVGLRHDNIAMIDKDCPEVLITARAFLPETLTTGKESTPDAHSWYIPTGGVPKFTPFKDVDGDMIIELRFDSGHQTLIPPSVHPEGERYVVGSAAEVREWDAAEMRRGVGMAATAALIARHLPPGGRHDLAKHIMGYLQRNGESEEDALAICEAAWEVVDAPAEAFRDLRTLAASTAQKLSDEKPVSGGKKLGEEWDEKLPGKIADIDPSDEAMRLWGGDTHNTLHKSAREDRQQQHDGGPEKINKPKAI